MIKINYNKEDGTILGYYPDEIQYSNIPKPYIEVTDEEHAKIINSVNGYKVIKYKLVENAPYQTTIDDLITVAKNKHKNNHEDYKAKEFKIVLTRKDKTKDNLTFTLDCTDKIKNNIDSALKTSESGEVYFYDDFGIGSWITHDEMKSIHQTFNKRLNSSFVIKGKGRIAIMNCSNIETVSTLPDKFNKYFNDLYDLLNEERTEIEVRRFLDSLEF